jgi:hypothetical protein
VGQEFDLCCNVLSQGIMRLQSLFWIVLQTYRVSTGVGLPKWHTPMAVGKRSQLPNIRTYPWGSLFLPEPVIQKRRREQAEGAIPSLT